MYLELLRGCKSEQSSSVQFINAGEKNILLNRELIVVVRKSSVEADQACRSDPVEARQPQHLLDDMQTLILLDQDSSDHHGNQAHDVVDKNASRSSLIAAAPERPLLSAVSWSHLPSGRTKNGSSAVVVSQLISIGGSAATAVTDPPRLNIDHSSFDSDESASEMQGNFEITIQRTNLGTAQEMIKVDHLISAAGAASHHQQLQELIPCADRQQICGDSDLTSEHHMTDPESSKSSTEEAPEEYDVVDHLQQRHAAHLTTSMSSGLNAAAAAATTTTTMMQQPQEPAEDDDDPSLLLPSAQILMRMQPLATALAPADQTNLNFVEQSFFPSTPFLHRDDQNTDQDVEIGYTRPQNQRLPLLAEATSKAPGLTHVTSEPACTSGTVNSEATAEQQTRDIHEYRRQQHKLLLHDESTDDDNNNSSSNKLMSRSACNRLHEYSSPAAGSLDHGNHERSWTLAPAATAGSKRRLPETGFNSGEPPHEWLQLSLRSSISAEAATAAAGATAAKTGYRTQIESCSSDQAMKASVALTAAAVVTDQPSLDLSFGTRPVVSAAAAPVPVLNNTSCTSEGKNVNHSVSARASHYDQGLEAAAGSLLERLEICRAPAVARDHARVPSPSTDPNPNGSYKRLQTLGQTSRQISTSSSLSSTLMLMTTAAAAIDPSCSGRPLMRGVGAAGGLDDYVQLMSSSSRRGLTTTTTTPHIYTRSPDPGSSTSCLQQQQPDQTSSLSLPFAEREFIGVPAAAACNNSLQSNPVSTSCPAWACTQAPAAATPPPPRDFASCFHNKLNPNVEPHHQLQLSSAQVLEGLMPNTGTFPNSAGIFPNSSRIFANSTGIFPHTGFSSSQCSPLFERTSSVGNKFCKEIQFGVLQDHGSCPDLPGHVITAEGPKNYERPEAPPQQLPPPCPARGLGQSAMVRMPSSGGFGGAARLGLGWPLSSSNEISLSTNTTSENLGLVAVEAAAAAAAAEGNAIEKGSSSPDSLQKLLKSVAGPSVTICQPPTTLLQDVNHHFSFVKRGVLNPPSLRLSNYVEGINQPSLSWMPMTTPWGAGPSWDPSLGFSGQAQANVFNGESVQVHFGSPSLSRPHPGLWFSLQAALNQTRTPILEQIPRAFLHIKDEHMTVLVVKKYLTGKLRLESHSQVEITCKGQRLEPSHTLQHVRDTIWQAQNNNRNNNAVAVGESSLTNTSCKLRSEDVVMVLTYSRQHTDHSPTKNLLHSLT
ncbi:unnamed protein product [Sphagnum troendelagicum]|uniref:Uncharacterized protein n=1 Tax=Sphagnum troendelagicum TaxID=128251 RepID=A0ABP0UMB6_9BRYO